MKKVKLKVFLKNRRFNLQSLKRKLQFLLQKLKNLYQLIYKLQLPTQLNQKFPHYRFRVFVPQENYWKAQKEL